MPGFCGLPVKRLLPSFRCSSAVVPLGLGKTIHKAATSLGKLPDPPNPRVETLQLWQFECLLS